MKRERVLMAVCGSNDPNFDNDPTASSEKDGPVLTTLNWTVSPYDRLVVLYTASSDRWQNTFESRAKNTASLAQKRYSSMCRRDLAVEVKLLPVKRIFDPNYVFPGLVRWLQNWYREQSEPFPQVFVDLSPGTPAVQMCWMLVVATNLFPVSLVRSLRKGEEEDGKRVVDVYINKELMPPVDKPGWISDMDMNMEDVIRENRELVQQKAEVWKQYEDYGIITRDPGMLESLQRLTRFAEGACRRENKRAHVLLLGETGTGKELMAKMFYRLTRPDKPYKTLDCAGLSSELLRSELFGHKKGSFTGAIEDKKGILESGDGGVAFLDEIGEMDPNIQAKLLRFLENGEISPVGANVTKKVDVLVVAATNKDIDTGIENGSFRRDISHRFRQVEIPPLRRRKRDIRILARHFLEQNAGERDLQLQEQVLEIFERYEWPGNVRQLKGVIEDLVDMAPQEATVLSVPLLRRTWKEYQVAEAAANLPFTIAETLPEKFDYKQVTKLFHHHLAHRFAELNTHERHGGSLNLSKLGQRFGADPKTFAKFLHGKELDKEMRLPSIE